MVRRVATIAELPPGTAQRVRVGDRAIALFNVGGALHALDDHCPHEGGRLSLGTVEAGTVRCPVHGACFALATGHALEPPVGEPMGPPVDRGVRVCSVRVIDHEIYVDV